MLNVFTSSNSRFKQAITLVVLFSFVVTLSACEPLRKKFTRKKKKDDNQSSKFIPLLEPIDYPAVQTSPEEKYKYHFSLWKVWYKDLVESVEEIKNDKRSKYLLNEMIEQVQEMKSYLNPEKQVELDGYLQELEIIRLEFDKPEAIRLEKSILNRLAAVDKKIRNQAKPQLMKDFFVLPEQL